MCVRGLPKSGFATARSGRQQGIPPRGCKRRHQPVLQRDRRASAGPATLKMLKEVKRPNFVLQRMFWAVLGGPAARLLAPK